jgi:alanine dehydrogenase
LNVHQGKITCEPVAKELGDDFIAPEIALAS